MGLNTRIGKATLQTSGTATAANIAITWTANEPTAGVTQTIADGSVPTVAELGQYVANINAQLANVLADNAAMRADLVSLYAQMNAGE